MSERICEGVSRVGDHRIAVVLALLACLVIAGCAQHDSSSEEDRPAGFYGGVSGGRGM